MSQYMGSAQHTFTTAITTSVVIVSAAAAAESGAETGIPPPTRTCFFFSLEICCSTMVISRSTRSIFWISSSLESRGGTSSNSGSACGGLGGDTGSSLPVRLRSCGGGKTGVESVQGAPPSPNKLQVSSHDFRHQRTRHLSCQPPCPKSGLLTDPTSLPLPSLVLLPGVPSPAFSKVQILFILLHASFPNRPSSREALPLSFPHNTPLSYPTYPVCALPPDQTPREPAPRPTTSRLMLREHLFTMLSPNQQVTEYHTQCKPSFVDDVQKHTGKPWERDTEMSKVVIGAAGEKAGIFTFFFLIYQCFSDFPSLSITLCVMKLFSKMR